MADSVRRQAEASQSLRGLRVLVVEDHPDSREMFREMVRAAGGRPMVAVDGQQALEILRTARPHVVLCDLLMPGLDGFAVARRLRADPRYAKIPIVAVTGLRRRHDYLRTLEAGFDAHLVKPIDYDTLVSLLTRFANRVRPPRRAASRRVLRPRPRQSG